ncbi:MAG: hypothetical protein QHH74_05625 [Spirochaetota bacterium]|nr:hypothetical protein [Spirochaetota bacterium]
MNIIKIVLYSILFTSICIFPACDRLDMYDIASGKSRTAYAISYDGFNYKLIIANVNYLKIFNITPGFPNKPGGISVSQRGSIIVYDASSTILIQNDLQTWAPVAPNPNDPNVLGFNDSFVCFDTTSLYINQLSETFTWLTTIGSFPANTLGIFKGNNYEIYVVEPDGTNVNIYTMNNPTTPIFTAILGISINNPFGGFKTKNYFYLWYTNTVNSIFRITPTSTTTLNSTTAVGNSLIDVTVTDDDNVFAIVTETGTYQLKHIISDNNYPAILNFGSIGNFNIDSLDDRHIVIASSGNTSGYNGLFIYDVDDNKIVKHITSTDVIALYVLR